MSKRIMGASEEQDPDENQKNLQMQQQKTPVQQQRIPENTDLQAFKDENIYLRSLLDKLGEEKNWLEIQLNELEAEVLLQEQLSLRESRGFQYFQDIFQRAPTGLLLLDEHAYLLEINQHAGELLNLDPQQLHQENLRTWLKKESSLDLLNQLKILPQASDPLQRVLVLNSGQLLISSISLLQNSLFLLAIESVSLEHLSSQSLFLANSVIEQLREAVMLTDTRGRIVRINQAFSQITGYTAKEILGHTPQILSSGRHDQNFYQELWSEIKRHGWWQGEIWNRRKTGEIYPEWLQISRVHDDFSGQNFYVGIFSDVSERKANQDQLDRLAFYDLLTGLPNRTLMTRFLEAKLLRVKSEQDSLAVMFIDLDKFKEVNDHYGHAEGDKVLRQTTQRLISRVRENDLASRIGGDEFVVILSRLTEHASAEKVAKDLIDVLSEPYVTDRAAHYLTASIGIAFYPSHGQDVGDLMRRADAAMYRAKSKGRNNWQIFDKNQEVKTLANKKIIDLLWKAIAEPVKYLQMHYQPIFSAAHPVQALEYEALVRLKDEKGQLIFPDHFIELAEKDNVFKPLGLAIFEAVCADFRKYRVPKNLLCCINLSPVQFLDIELLSQLQQRANNQGLSLQQFNFEVTETAMMHNMALMSDTLTQIQRSGSSISLDDFGTGYASLSMLKNLPVNVLKIDRSFVQDLETSNEARTLVKAMIAMAQALGLKIVTEGVETQAQLDWLNEQGVDFVQGFLLGRPKPAIDCFQDAKSLEAENLKEN